MVGALDWFDDSIARFSETRERRVLVARRHGFAGDRLVYLIAGPPPADFVQVGVSSSASTETSYTCSRLCPWEALAKVLLMEDLWERDRRAYEALAKWKRAEADKALELWRTGGVAETSWADMETGLHFRDWTRIPKRVVQAARRLIQDAARELHALSVDAREEDRIDVLRRCVERFNELDEANGHFIETVEAEGILHRLGLLARLSGLDRIDRLADKWRHW